MMLPLKLIIISTNHDVGACPTPQRHKKYCLASHMDKIIKEKGQESKLISLYFSTNFIKKMLKTHQLQPQHQSHTFSKLFHGHGHGDSLINT